MQGKRNRDGLTEAEFLKAYEPGDYERPSVTVDMLIFAVDENVSGSYRDLKCDTLKLLMVRRADHPCIDQWALPGGFVNMDEDLETAARRELKEETDVEAVCLEQLYTWGDVGRDPRTRIISVSYLAIVDGSAASVKAGDDAAEARWFSISSQTLSKRRVAVEGGFLEETVHRLQLHGEGDVLSAQVKTLSTVQRHVRQTAWEVVESGGIAFDHAMVIHHGLKHLTEKSVLYDCTRTDGV